MLVRLRFGLLFVAITPLAAVAQQPTSPPPITADPLTVPPLPEPAATAVLVSDSPAATDSIDVVAGFPLSVRYQRRIGQTRFWGEAGAGLLLIVPEAFVGVRTDWGLYEGRRDSFRVRPGLDAHVAVWPYGSVLGESGDRVPAVAGVSLDVDLVWRRGCEDGGRTEFGVKLGVITLINRHEVLPLPVFGVLCGYRF